MGDDGTGRPAARAYAPPPDPQRGDLSGPRLAAPRSEGPPTTPARPVGTDWALATAPTLLLKPVDESDDAASTSRIPTVPPMTDDAVSTARIPTAPPTAGGEEQPWFKTGTTLPPPSMRPSGESIAPAPERRPPNPRVLKVVFGVIAGCLFIVAIACIKLVYKRVRGTEAQTSSGESSAPKVALAEPAKTSPPPSTAATEPPPSAPEPTAAAGTAAASAPSESAHRAAPVRSSPRTTTKTTTHRAPVPKKPVRGTR